MSAPNTNIEKQKRRHRGPLIGMVVVVIFALTAVLYVARMTPDEGLPVTAEPGATADPASNPTAAPTAPATPPTQP